MGDSLAGPQLQVPRGTPGVREGATEVAGCPMLPSPLGSSTFLPARYWHHICHHHPLSPKSCWAQGMTLLPKPARLARLGAKAEDGVA